MRLPLNLLLNTLGNLYRVPALQCLVHLYRLAFGKTRRLCAPSLCLLAYIPLLTLKTLLPDWVVLCLKHFDALLILSVMNFLPRHNN